MRALPNHRTGLERQHQTQLGRRFMMITRASEVRGWRLMAFNSLGTRLRTGHTLAQRMLDIIGRDIIDGKYDSQTFPTETALSAQLGVSRSVTREAIKMLTAKGMLTARPRQGTSVQARSSWNYFDTDVFCWLIELKPSATLLRQLNEVRAAIEPEAAALAALNATEDECAMIASAVDSLRLVDTNIYEYQDALRRFHLSIVRACKNPFFAQFDYLIEVSLQTYFRMVPPHPDTLPSIGALATVQGAIARHHPGKARRAMKSIITINEAGLQRRFPNQNAARAR